MKGGDGTKRNRLLILVLGFLIISGTFLMGCTSEDDDDPDDENGGNGNTTKENVKPRVKEATKQFRADDPLKAASSIIEGLSLLRELRISLTNENLDNDAGDALYRYLSRKITDFEEVSTQ